MSTAHYGFNSWNYILRYGDVSTGSDVNRTGKDNINTRNDIIKTVSYDNNTGSDINKNGNDNDNYASSDR